MSGSNDAGFSFKIFRGFKDILPLRPLFLPAIFYLAGVLAGGLYGARYFSHHAPIIIGTQVAIFIFAVILIRRTRVFFILLLVFFMSLGMFRYAAATLPGKDGIHLFLDETKDPGLVYGRVASDPVFSRGAYYGVLSFDLDVKKAILRGKEKNVSGILRASLYDPRKKAPRIGDSVAFSGRLSLFPGAMNPARPDMGAMYRRRGVVGRISSSSGELFGILSQCRGPFTSMRRFLADLRVKAAQRLKERLSPRALAMAESVTLGLRSGIGRDTRDILARTGTMHILAVSGLHVGIVAVILLGVLRFLRLPRPVRNALASAGILAFAAFTGCRPSSLRAAIMASLFLLSSSFGRKPDIINALAVSAFIITFLDPGQLFTPGFLLSYLAVISIVWLTPATDRLLGVEKNGKSFFSKTGRYLLKAVSVSLAVWIGTMPVIAGYFGIITPSCLIANIVAVPALFLMILSSAGILAVPSALASSFPGNLPALFMERLTLFLTRALSALGSLPGAHIRVPPPGAAITLLFYAALVSAIFMFSRRGKKIYLVCFIVFAADLFLLKELSLRPPNKTRITIFHTGKSDASAVEFPDGKVLLVDTGTAGPGGGLDSGRDVIAPYLARRGIRKIDCVVLTHPHEDHIGGFLYLLKNFKVGTVIDSGIFCPETSPGVYKDILKAIEMKRLPLLAVKGGQAVKGFPYAEIKVLSPPEPGFFGHANNDSVVLNLILSGGTVMFTGDAESPALERMLVYGGHLRSGIMKAPHHGGGMGDRVAVDEFFRLSLPEYIVVTNKMEARLFATLQDIADKAPGSIIVTGASGAVTVTDTEEGLVVETFR